MTQQHNIITNRDFFTQEQPRGSVVQSIQKHQRNNEIAINSIHKENDTYVIKTLMDDPAAPMVPASLDYDGLTKATFSKLGKGDAPEDLVQKAESLFGLGIEAIREQKRTIGTMTVVAFVFDQDKVASDKERVQIAVVQRTQTGPDGTPNLGALSRTGGQMQGGIHGQGIHGPQHIGNQTFQKFWEELHPFIKNEDGILVPMDIIPHGYELDGLKGEFMAAAMEKRLELSRRIEGVLNSKNFNVSPLRKTFQAAHLHIPSLSEPIIQIIDGQEILHENLIPFDSQLTNQNLDWNTDSIIAVHVPGLSPEDIIFKDGETDQNTNRLLDRIIFLGKLHELKHAVDGNIIKLHAESDLSKPAKFSPSLPRIIRCGDEIAHAALDQFT